MEKQSTEKAPEPKPEKPVKKTASFAEISVLSIAVGIAVLILGAIIGNIALKIALIVTLLGVTVSLISGIIGFFQILSSKSRLKGYSYCFISFFLLLLIVAMVVPNFLRFSARAKQGEAKQNLGAIFTDYYAYHSDYHTFPISPTIQAGNTVYNCLSIAGWEPRGQIRYNYDCMNTEAFSPTSNDSPCPPGIVSSATKDSFTVAACGNIDRDAAVDVWTIDDAKHLKNVIDDVKE